MALTSQEKLALALTSAGSLRALGRQMGVSHQKLGRWLREGKPLPPDADGVIPTRRDGSIKVYGLIPDADPIVKLGIDIVFKEHVKAVKKAAYKHDVPFDPIYPAMAIRKPLRTGAPGDRVFIEGTQFIDRDLRKRLITRLGQSGDYFAATIQSEIDMVVYAETEAEREHATFSSVRKKRFTKMELRDSILRSMADTVNKGKVITDENRFRPLYTQRESIARGTDIKKSVDAIERRLREKMEPASDFGAGLATSYVFQLKPETYVERPKPTPAAKAKQARKASVTDIRAARAKRGTQGRGNK